MTLIAALVRPDFAFLMCDSKAVTQVPFTVSTGGRLVELQPGTSLAVQKFCLSNDRRQLVAVAGDTIERRCRRR